MVGVGAVDEAEPVFEAVLVRRRGISMVVGHTQMPFAEVSRSIACVPEDFGKGRFALEKMHLVKRFVDDGIDPCANVMAAGKKGCARGGADWGSGVEVGEAYAIGSQFVENGGLDGAPVASDVAVA